MGSNSQNGAIECRSYRKIISPHELEQHVIKEHFWK